jgi:hypothetical protein
VHSNLDVVVGPCRPGFNDCISSLRISGPWRPLKALLDRQAQARRVHFFHSESCDPSLGSGPKQASNVSPTDT